MDNHLHQDEIFFENEGSNSTSCKEQTPKIISLDLNKIIEKNDEILTNTFFKLPDSKNYIINNQKSLIGLAIKSDNGIFIRGLFNVGVQLDLDSLSLAINLNKKNCVIALVYILYNKLTNTDLLSILNGTMIVNNYDLFETIWDILNNKAPTKRLNETYMSQILVGQNIINNNINAIKYLFGRFPELPKDHFISCALTSKHDNSIKINLIKLLMDHNCNAQKDGNNTLTSIIQSNNLTILKFMIEQGCDKNDAAFIAAQYQNLTMLNYLIKQGCDVNFDNYKILRYVIKKLTGSYHDTYIQILYILLDKINDIYVCNNYFIKKLCLLNNHNITREVINKCDNNSLNYYLNKSQKFNVKYNIPVNHEEALYWSVLFNDHVFFKMWHNTKRFQSLNKEYIWKFMIDLHHKQPLPHEFAKLCGDKYKNKDALSLQTLCENKFDTYII